MAWVITEKRQHAMSMVSVVTSNLPTTPSECINIRVMQSFTVTNGAAHHSDGTWPIQLHRAILYKYLELYIVSVGRKLQAGRRRHNNFDLYIAYVSFRTFWRNIGYVSSGFNMESYICLDQKLISR